MPGYLAQRLVCAGVLLCGGLAAGGEAVARTTLRVIFQPNGPKDPTGLLYGSQPTAIARAADGTLFITMAAGGRTLLGTILRIDGKGPAGLGKFGLGLESIGLPIGRVVVGPDDSIYGAATEVNGGGPQGVFKGGVVFRITPNNTQTVLHRFICDPCNTFTTPNVGGYDPSGDLLQGVDGALYGATIAGGRFGSGVVYRLTLAGQFSVLHDFAPSEGTPVGSLIQLADGSVIGAAVDRAESTFGGATNPGGSVFRIARGGAFSVLHQFDPAQRDGLNPTGGLLQASDGYLYGLTTLGGTHNVGTIYRLQPDGGGYQSLASFNGTNGSQPLRSALVEGADHKLYGTTYVGGAPGGGDGTCFRYGTAGGLELLASFRLNSNLFTTVLGGLPRATLAAGPGGSFYGVNSNSGFSNAPTQPTGGSIFQLKP